MYVFVVFNNYTIMEEIKRLQYLAGLNEVKVNNPVLSEEDKETIYGNLTGGSKHNDINDIEIFDLNKLSPQYLEDMGYEIEDLDKNYPLLSPSKIRQALKELPIIDINNRESHNIQDIYLNRRDQYSLLRKSTPSGKDIIIFVNNEGYDYPRYTMVIEGL